MLYMRQVNVTATIVKIVVVVLCIGLVVGGAYLGGEWLWWRLANYIQPATTTGRKDLVNIFVLIAAGVVGFLTASAAIGNFYMSRRNLKQQRELEERRAQDDALQAYYEQMGDLLAVHKLAETKRDDDPLRLLAQAQTRTVLSRVDATRKGYLVHFLSGARLITGVNRIINLSRTNLSNSDLSGADLSNSDLSFAYLKGASLEEAILRGSDLRHAYLEGANLWGADLTKADLSFAYLRGANFENANLKNANLQESYLKEANLRGVDDRTADFKGAIMPEGLKYEDWLQTSEE